MAQYPLDMGRPGQKGAGAGKGGQTLALTVNAEGDINYDAVLKQGKAAQKHIASTHGALVPKVDLLNPEVGMAETGRGREAGLEKGCGGGVLSSSSFVLSEAQVMQAVGACLFGKADRGDCRGR